MHVEALTANPYVACIKLDISVDVKESRQEKGEEAAREKG
jgi:hypothetical protein